MKTRKSNLVTTLRAAAPLAATFTLLLTAACGGPEEASDDEGVEEELRSGFTRLQSADSDLIRRCLVTTPQAGHVPTIEYCANSRPGQGWSRLNSGLVVTETAGGAQCLTVNAAGNGVVMNACNATVVRQKWTYGGVETVAGVTGRRIKAHDGRCLTLIGGHPTTLAACGVNKRQIWNVISTPTNELNLPAGNVGRPASPFWSFNASELTKATTANAIVRWEAAPLAFWLGDESCGGAFGGGPHFQLVDNGVVLTGLDAAGHARAKFAVATSYNVCDMLPDYSSAARITFGDGTGEYGMTFHQTCSALSPCPEPDIVREPFQPGPKGRRLLQLMRHDLSLAPRPKALTHAQQSQAVVNAVQNADSGTVKVGIIFSDGSRASVEKNIDDLPKSPGADRCFWAMSADPRNGCPPGDVSRAFSLTMGWECQWGGLEVGECNLSCCPKL